MSGKSWMAPFVLALPLVLGGIGCDCAGPGRNGVCNVPSPPAACGESCSSLDTCPAGFYCADGACTADCSDDVACPSGTSCSPTGMCMGGNDGSVLDVEPRDVMGSDNTCAAVDVGAERVTPNVIVIVDRSGSMEDNEFPEDSGVTRWDALRDALLDEPAGLLFSLQASVRFGLVTYDESGTPAGCPDLETVPTAISNFTTIEDRYRALEARGGTPTGDSIVEILDRLDDLVPSSDPGDPTIFILATDGEPDTCEDGDDEVNGRRESVEAVTSAFGMGIRTYVISVGTDVSTDHLQAVANAGIGDSDAPFWVASDTAGLNTALETIIGGVVDCRLTLEGAINPELACSGTVSLDGSPIPCDDPDGWHVIDATTIELTGDACTELQGGATLTARFPCDVVVE
jgi:hypothetical protein